MIPLLVLLTTFDAHAQAACQEVVLLTEPKGVLATDQGFWVVDKASLTLRDRQGTIIERPLNAGGWRGLHHSAQGWWALNENGFSLHLDSRQMRRVDASEPMIEPARSSSGVLGDNRSYKLTQTPDQLTLQTQQGETLFALGIVESSDAAGLFQGKLYTLVNGSLQFFDRQGRPQAASDGLSLQTELAAVATLDQGRQLWTMDPSGRLFVFDGKKRKKRRCIQDKCQSKLTKPHQLFGGEGWLVVSSDTHTYLLDERGKRQIATLEQPTVQRIGDRLLVGDSWKTLPKLTPAEAPLDFVPGLRSDGLTLGPSLASFAPKLWLPQIRTNTRVVATTDQVVVSGRGSTEVWCPTDRDLQGLVSVVNNTPTQAAPEFVQDIRWLKQAPDSGLWVLTSEPDLAWLAKDLPPDIGVATVGSNQKEAEAFERWTTRGVGELYGTHLYQDGVWTKSIRRERSLDEQLP